jgi:hypothetical protein
VTDLADGDELHFGGHGALPCASHGTMTVSFTALAGATSYEVWNECTSVTTVETSVELEAFAGCPAPPFDWMVTAFDGELTLGYARAEAPVWVPGDDVVIPDDWADVTSTTITMQHVALDFSDIILDRFADSGRGAPLSRTHREIRAKGTLLGENLLGPSLGGDMDVRIGREDPDQPSPQWQRERLPSGGPYVYDSEVALLPWISGVEVEPTSRLAFWSATPAIEGIEVAGDAVYVQLHNDSCREPDPIAHWTVITPGDATSVQLPQIDGAVLPRPTDCWRNTATLVEDDLVEDYDAVRADADLDLARLCAGADRPGGTRARQSGAPIECH